MTAAISPTTDGTHASDDLERVLGAIEVHIRRQRRFAMEPGRIVVPDADALSLVYVISGSVRVDVDGREHTLLTAGDVLVAGGTATALIPDGVASVLVSELELAESAAQIAALLPEIAYVRGFDASEPAAAALAQHLGVDADVQCPDRQGDLVICRMMATTVLVSVIRAWTRTGCAPDGWPSISADPFLDRVVDAIHADPGREWTVGSLASVGAMSRTVFAERFRAVFGSSPASYVTSVRMRSAQELLSRGHGVSTVSRELGYASDEGFSRAFRRHTGMTPSAWRSAH